MLPAASKNSVPHEHPRRRVSVSIEVEKNDVSISDTKANGTAGWAGPAEHGPMGKVEKGAWRFPFGRQSVIGAGGGGGPSGAVTAAGAAQDGSAPPRAVRGRRQRSRCSSVERGRGCPELRGAFAQFPSVPPASGRGSSGRAVAAEQR